MRRAGLVAVVALVFTTAAHASPPPHVQASAWIVENAAKGHAGKAAKPARVTKARAAPKSKRRPARKPSAAAAAKA